MGWLGTQRSFEVHKRYLDAILQGQREFIHSKPASLAKIMRTLLKYVRDRKMSPYECLFGARVVQTKLGVEIKIETDPERVINEVHNDCTFYDILMHLSNPQPNRLYIFPKPRVSPEQMKTLQEFCKNSSLSFLFDRETGNIKATLMGDDLNEYQEKED